LPAGATAATPLPFTGLNDPQGLAVDTEGNVYVTDRGNAGVLQLRRGATAGLNSTDTVLFSQVDLQRF